MLLWEDRARLTWIAGGLASLPVLWLAPEYWGSGNAFRASDRAQNPRSDSIAFADNPALEVFKHAIGLAPALAVAFAFVAVALAGVVVARAARPRHRAAQRDRRPRPRSARGGVDRARRGHDRPRLQRQRALPHRPGVLVILLGAVGAAWALSAALPRVAPRLVAVAAVALAALFVIPDADRFGQRCASSSTRPTCTTTSGGSSTAPAGPSTCAVRPRVHRAVSRPAVAWRLNLHQDVDLRPRGERAVIFHVRHTRRGFVAPPYPRARPNLLGREGHWALTADCEARG